MPKQTYKHLITSIFAQSHYFLTAILIVFTLLRLPSFIEPHWYGDEGIYQVIGQSINEGRVLYSEIWDNKPPLLYYVYALVNGDQFSARILSWLIGGAAIVAFFALSSRLFTRKIIPTILTIIFTILFGVPLLEGNIANAENFMLLPIILGFYLVLSHGTSKRWHPWAAAGLLFSLAFLTKVVAVFDFSALLIFLLVMAYDKYKDPRRVLRKIGHIYILIAAFIVPIFFTFLYYLLQGAHVDFLRAVFSSNVGYVGVNNYFLFPLGFVLLKIAVLISVLSFITIKRKIFGPVGIFILYWTAFSFFGAFFSDRPYTHYLLLTLPSLLLLVGLGIEHVRLKLFSFIVLALLLVFINNNFVLYQKNFAYYQNYFAYMTGLRNERSYQSFFDQRTPDDYEIAQYIRTNTQNGEKVFVWGDSGQIYVLSDKLPPGKYIVAYHITFYPDAIEETQQMIDTEKPKYIIDVKRSDFGVRNFLSGYRLKFMLEYGAVYEREHS